MAATLEDLEKRIETLESEFGRLRGMVERPLANESRAERGARMVREARESQAALSAAAAIAWEKMGITGEPIEAEKMQALMIASGLNPDDNLASREILAMREE